MASPQAKGGDRHTVTRNDGLLDLNPAAAPWPLGVSSPSKVLKPETQGKEHEQTQQKVDTTGTQFDEFASSEVNEGTSSMSSPFDLLDEELCRHLLTFLDGKSAIRMCSTSRDWRGRGKDLWIWEQIIFREFVAQGHETAHEVELLKNRQQDIMHPYKVYKVCREVADFKKLRLHALYKAGELMDERPEGSREGHAIVKCGNFVYLYLGFVRDRDIYCLKLNPETGTGFADEKPMWKSVPLHGDKFPGFTYGHTMCSHNDETIIMFGGMASGGYQNEVNDLYFLRPRIVDGMVESISIESPTTGGSCPARGYHSACVYEDHMYVYGGLADSQPQSCLWKLSLKEPYEWTFEAGVSRGLNATYARYGHSCVVHKDVLYIIGGGDGHDLLRSGREKDDILMYKLKDGSGEFVSIEPTGSFFDNNLGRCHSGVQIGNKFLLFGGSRSTCSTLSVLDLDTLTFYKPLVESQYQVSPRISCPGLNLGNGRVFFYGGYSISEGSLDDWIMVDARHAAVSESVNVVPQVPVAPRVGRPDAIMSNFLIARIQREILRQQLAARARSPGEGDGDEEESFDVDVSDVLGSDTDDDHDNQQAACRMQ